MDIKVDVPVASPDFNFDSTCSSPYMTAPSSPQRLGSSFFLSAPTSPPRSSSFAVPFDWEEKPGIPKRKGFTCNANEDFEFEFSGQLDRTSLSADELFDGGKIRPLKPPPGFSHFSSSSPKSPRKKDNIDPFEAAIEKSRKSSVAEQNIRGRERTSSSSSSHVHKKSRSLSPFRVWNTTMLEQDETVASNTRNPKSYVSSIFSVISFPKGNKIWKLKDLLWFRSTSEGSSSRATTSDDSFKKYAVLSKKEAEDVRNSSFRSAESVGSRRRGPPVSAHEMHYMANRAVSEEMTRKTFLPYKQGLLGCLGFKFNPGMNEVSKGIVSLTRG